MANASVTAPSPKRYRIGIWFFSALLTLLVWWLGNYVLHDIASVEPFAQVDESLLDQESALLAEQGAIQQDLEDARARRAALEASTSGTQITLNQLIEIRRVDASRAEDPASQQAFLEAESIFLENQRQQQALNQQIADLETRQRQSSRSLEPLSRQIQEARSEIWKRHRLLLAGTQFLFLVPFVLLGVYLFRRFRKSSYVPLVHAFNVAALTLLVQTIHRHFPSDYFKYIALGLAIVIVLSILAYIIRQITRPDQRWLLQRHKEAYRAAQCPSCQYPILGDNMRAVFPDKRFAKKDAQEVQGTEKPRTCPACGTRLFHLCADCGALRHSLLPYCLHCGAVDEK
jgi:hypothetical protein